MHQQKSNNLYNTNTSICHAQNHANKQTNAILNNYTVGGYGNNINQSTQRPLSIFDTPSSAKNSKESQKKNGNLNNTNSNSNNIKQRFSISNNLYEQTRKRIQSQNYTATNSNNNTIISSSLNNEYSFLSSIDMPTQDISAQNSKCSTGVSPKQKNFLPIKGKNANQQQALVMNAIKNKIQNIFQQQQIKQQTYQQPQVSQTTQQQQTQQTLSDQQQSKLPQKKKRELVLTLKKSTENLQDVYQNNPQTTKGISSKSTQVKKNKFTEENIAPQQMQRYEQTYDDEYEVCDTKFINQINKQKKPPQPKKGATVPTNQSIQNLQNNQHVNSNNYNSNNLSNVKKMNRYGAEDSSKKQVFQLSGYKQIQKHDEQFQNEKNENISVISQIFSKSTNTSASKSTTSKSPFQGNPTPNQLKKPKLLLNTTNFNNRESSFSVDEENQSQLIKDVENLNTQQLQQQEQQEQRIQSLRQILNDNTNKIQNTPPTMISVTNDNDMLKIENTNIVLNQSKETSIQENNFEIKDWALVQTPITPEEALQKYTNYLTDYEKTEIKLFPQVYFLGHLCSQKFQKGGQYNNGFDDQRGDYNINLFDHIAYRYELLESLGQGSFGSVIKVFDHKRKEFLALKIIRNKKKFHNQALIELNILSFIKEHDKEESTNIVRVKDFVIFRKHVCLVFELLSINLYELLRNNKYKGLSLELIRRFAIQILNSINFLRKHRIIHCDLKPENILLKQSNKSGVKLVDFGSSCFENERLYSYIQSRYYRAPEVVLGVPYDMAIDMWSFGCIIAELFIGYPIFPGEDEQEQMGYIWEIIGTPSPEFLQNCTRRKYFFNEDFTPKLIPNAKGKTRVPNSKTLKSVLQTDSDEFADFLSKCFVWEPQKRLKPSDALMHEWILQGLPSEIRMQHIKYIQTQAEIERLAQEKKEIQIKKDNQSILNQMEQDTINIESIKQQSCQIIPKDLQQKSQLKDLNQFGIPQNLDVQSSKNAQEKNKNTLYIPSPANNHSNQSRIQMKSESTKNSYEPNVNLMDKQLYFASQKRKQAQIYIDS